MRKRLPSLAIGLLLAVGCTIKSSNSDAGDDAGGGRERTAEVGGAGASGVGAADAGTGEGGKGGAAGAGNAGGGKGGAAEAGNAGGGKGGAAEAGNAGGGKGGTAEAGNAGGGKGGAAEAGNAGGGKGGTAGAGSAGSTSQVESLLDIANAELAEGAVDAVLDEDTVLTRTVVDNQITHWEVTVTGIPALVVDYGQDGTTVSVDEDLDGIFELVKTISGSTESDMTVVEERAGEDESAATRQILTRTSGDEIHMLGEVMTEDGGWETVDEIDASTREIYDAAIVVDAGASLCTPDQVRLLEEAAQSVLDKGVDCLKRRGLTGLAASLQSIAASNGFSIACKSISELAYADVPQWESNQLDSGYHVGPAQIEFNPNCIAALGSPVPCGSNYTTEGLLFHEMLHFIRGAHSASMVLALKDILFDPYEEVEKDLIYSCQFACFDSSPLLTKCSCAMCSANYKVCGPECASAPECKDPTKGCGKYHCSCDGVDYPSVGECNSACRVSLGCFSGICTPVP